VETPNKLLNLTAYRQVSKTLGAVEVLRAVKIIGLTFAGLAAVSYAATFAYRTHSGELAFTSKFRTIDLGSPIEEAIAELGPPFEITDEFRLGQRAGFENAYLRAADSNSEKYYIWSCCVDMTYTLGVDSRGVIVVAEYGGT
jgi:hypothetical protein